MEQFGFGVGVSSYEKPALALEFDAARAAFVLHAQYQDKPRSILALTRRFTHYPLPVRLTGTEDSERMLSPEEFFKVRAWLQTLDTASDLLNVKMDSIARAARQGNVPPNFTLRFLAWGDSLTCMLPSGATPLSGQGWFLLNDTVFRIDVGFALSAALRGPVSGGALASLLVNELPALRRSGIRVECPFAYDAAPNLRIRVEAAGESILLYRERGPALRPLAGTPYGWDGSTLHLMQGDGWLESPFSFGGQGASIWRRHPPFCKAGARRVESDAVWLRRRCASPVPCISEPRAYP